MKAVPKVDTDGLFIEDVITDDSFTGVVPFYADQPVTADEQPEGEPQPAGYIIGVPVLVGLFKPRFDLMAWEAYQKVVSAALDEYQGTYDEWTALPEEERGEAPIYVSPEQPILWVEGLTQEEIDELTKPPATETPEEKMARLEQENALLKAQNAALSERADFIEDVVAEMALQVYQ
ncbi:hypothetical protein OIN60_19840 [Paenibacillus sp. P96]|uniref:Bacteriophage SP-beta YorD domain-containing protein n=1 Tax=Paenibacillus zeirhizosphaerae TaxID=2987519 RepID=A0ABT9FWA2_9BACL|nr:hypothetical protein [Paenibacillus sp. P96]MDP4098980.1 hypothetical protein [Paenibacillus sp. P96]